ncbi:4Fe-4S binding protein [Thermogutta sp.]|uniref:4Fe-4S binding protein n=1 Tax=Thermogutta sp. TaxID=1962930 RepID=UPI00321F7887
MAWEWRLIQNECTGCGICADVCPHEAISMPREAAYPEPGPSFCIGCMACVKQCPFDAIEVKQLTALPAE